MPDSRLPVPLAPAPPRDEQDVPPPEPEQAVPTTSSVHRRKNVSMSCTACKQSKSKCTGTPPCETCVKKNLECQFNEDDDSRRKTSLKRKIADLEEDHDLLLRLVEALRDSEPSKTMQILNLIRSHAPLDEIRLSVAEKLDGVQQSGDIARDTTRPRAFRDVMSIQRLTDISEFNVPAKSWTSVTDDTVWSPT